MLVQFKIVQIGTRLIYPCGFNGRYKCRVLQIDVADEKGAKTGDHHLIKISSDCFQHLFASNADGTNGTRSIYVDNVAGSARGNSYNFILDMRAGAGVDLLAEVTPAYGEAEFNFILITMDLQRLEPDEEVKLL